MNGLEAQISSIFRRRKFSKISKKGKGLKIVSAVSTPPFFFFENGKSPRISSLFFIDFMSYGVRIEVELLLQNRPPLFL